jgi:glucose/arabinose dehydrogenase
MMKEVFACPVLILCLLSLTNCKTSPAKNKEPEKVSISATDSIEVKLEMVTTAIEAPVELNVPSDGSKRRLITDNSGKIWILKNDTLVSKPFFNIHDKLGKQEKNSPIGSISSVAFHPRFSTNCRFYVCYNAPSRINAKGGKLVVSEFSTNTNNPDLADLESEYRVFELEGKNIGANVAQIVFGPDGYLYISIGDDKIADSTYIYHAQDLDYLNGKLLRIDVDRKPYAIPSDNPYVHTKNARPEIWASGFRKMWRFSFDPETDQLFGGDVGELQEEEINIVEKGANYGWPLKEGKSMGDKIDSTNTSILTAPIYNYPRNVGICIIGGRFYYGKEIPLLKNKYVFADFNGSIFALVKNEKEDWIRQPVKMTNKPGGVFLICGLNVDENNELYVMGFLNSEAGSKGVVYKIVKA